MFRFHTSSDRSRKHMRDHHVRILNMDNLEDRILLYSAYGDQWTYDSRITYSFMPDGTSIGGISSGLFQTLNANYPTATWDGQIEQAASLWEGATNANLALVSDGGEAVGSAGDQQDDPRFGDIRIGAIPLGSGILAETFLPPPANGGTDAGDIVFNSNVNWQIGSNYDLMTVAAHEFGHALGLGESTVSTAVMYGTYNGIKQALTSDDIAGIQSIYGAPQYDQFNTGGQRNNIYQTATNITSYISNAQIAIPSLDNTVVGDAEWYYVTVPSSTTGTMNVRVQSSNLSSFAPKLQVYSSSMSLVGQVSAANTFGATIGYSTSVTSGQSYYIKVLAAGNAGPIGGYGLLVNFGSQSQSPISPPNTVVPSEPSEGGGTINNVVTVVIGDLAGVAFQYSEGNGDGANGSSTGAGAQTATGGSSGTSGSSSVSTDTDVTSAQSLSVGTSFALAGISSLTTAVAVGPSAVVLQALDEALASWPSRRSSASLIEPAVC
jgi:hypothetical protein